MLTNSLPAFSDRLPLGTSGLMASPFCVGTVQSPETVLMAYERGINFFFVTCDMHWPRYEALRRGLEQLLRKRGVRDQIIVAGVCYPTQPEFCTSPFEELLEAVPNLKYIDLLVAGGAYAGECKRRLSIFTNHCAQGFVGSRGTGATFHDRRAAPEAINKALLDIAFIRYNAYHTGALRDTLPKVAPSATAQLYNFNSTHGFVPSDRLESIGVSKRKYWHPKITDHYRFVLSNGRIKGALISLRNGQELQELAKALELGPLEADEQACLTDLARLASGEATLL